MRKSIHWFMNEMVVKKRVTRNTAAFRPLVNRKVPCNIRKLISIVKMFGKKENNTYLLFNCERPDSDSLEESTLVIKV